MRMRPSRLSARTLAGSVILAVLVSGSLLAMVLALSSSRRSLERQSHSKDVAVAAVSLEKVVADLEAALHGYTATRKPRFRDSWNAARRALPESETRLASLVADNARERGIVSSVRSEIAGYLRDYAQPVVKIARIDPAAADSQVSQQEDKRRIGTIRNGLQQLLSLEDARAAARAHSVRTESRRALSIGIAALATSGGLILLYGIYLVTAVARPIRLTAAAASRVATGDFSARLPERGPDEIGELARAFNAMARSLEDGRRELTDQNKRLAEAERYQSELISIVSHEVRTPLSSLLGFTDILLRRELDEETRRRYLEIVHEQSRRLASLTRDFLDVRLLEEGRLEFTLEQIDLAEIAREQGQLYLAQAPDHALVLDLPERPLWVKGDRDRLSQVIGNLVANAVKYSPAGGPVEVRASRAGDRARVEVTDHGLGIPQEDQSLIFTKFYRGHAGASGIPGTGLGLAISQELVEAHGGTIAFSSRLGTGTTFSVELPAAA